MDNLDNNCDIRFGMLLGVLDIHRRQYYSISIYLRARRQQHIPRRIFRQNSLMADDAELAGMSQQMCV